MTNYNTFVQSKYLRICFPGLEDVTKRGFFKVEVYSSPPPWTPVVIFVQLPFLSSKRTMTCNISRWRLGAVENWTDWTPRSVSLQMYLSGCDAASLEFMTIQLVKCIRGRLYSFQLDTFCSYFYLFFGCAMQHRGS